MTAGRNIFGFDVTFTPARFYKSSVPMMCDTASEANRGLWDEAWCAAQLAQQLQDAEAAATRAYNEAQAALRTEVQNIQNGSTLTSRRESGCTPGLGVCRPADHRTQHSPAGCDQHRDNRVVALMP
jgi:hypothetical protein